jgi:hypothetical protein
MIDLERLQATKDEQLADGWTPWFMQRSRRR